MNEVVFSKSSWTYRFLTIFGEYSYRQPKDICALGRALLWVSFRLAFISVLLLGVCVILGQIAYEKMYCIEFAVCTAKILPGFIGLLIHALTGFIILAVGIALLLGFGLCAFLVYEWNETRLTRKRKAQRELNAEFQNSNLKPNAFMAAYQAFKDKTCFKIKFESSEPELNPWDD